MHPLLLADIGDIFAALVAVVAASLLFRIPILLTSFLTGRKVKTRYGGITLAKPGDLPRMVRGLSRTSKNIYAKVKDKLSKDVRKQINDGATSRANIAMLLTDLNKLKRDGGITEDEYSAIKEELIRKYTSKMG